MSQKYFTLIGNSRHTLSRRYEIIFGSYDRREVLDEKTHMTYWGEDYTQLLVMVSGDAQSAIDAKLAEYNLGKGA